MVVEKIQIETSEIDLKDTQIFKAIFNMFYPRAYTFTLKLLRDEVISADITQEAFLYMWEKAYRFPDMMSFKAYLYSCLKNKTLNYIRDHKVERNMEELKDVFVDDILVDHLVIEHELKAKRLKQLFSCLVSYNCFVELGEEVFHDLLLRIQVVSDYQ